jgi:hypothetical protein
MLNSTTTNESNIKDGRQFHTDVKSKYWLPMDTEEAERLDNVGKY